MKPYEIFSHTADIGLKIYGKDLKELFVNAAEGMFSVMLESKKGKPGIQDVVIDKRAQSADALLVEWLDELLFAFSSRYVVPDKYIITEISEKSLRAKVICHILDKKRDRVLTEVKAVTYHELYVKKLSECFSAQVIIDV